MYFDETPIGRIVNRFAPDFDTIDNILPTLLRRWFLALTYVIAVLVIIIYSVPWMVFGVMPVVTIFIIVQVQITIFFCHISQNVILLSCFNGFVA